MAGVKSDAAPNPLKTTSEQTRACSWVTRREWGAIMAAGWLGACRSESAELTELRLDWAYYSPLSIVLRHHGSVEAAFRSEGVRVTWLLSLGSNRALELLATESADFCSTAGAPAILSRANGNRIKSIYVASAPEWVALVVARDSPIQSVAELRGKTIAATKGTDAFVFLVRSLRAAGLSPSDVRVIHLQHPDGRAALERGDVEAWAGLDPHMATSELEQRSRLLFREPAYNSLNFLTTREEFLREHPNASLRVLELYERARRWALSHPRELVKLYSQVAKVSEKVAQRVLQRHDFRSIEPTEAQRAALVETGQILKNEGYMRDNAEPAQTAVELLDFTRTSSLAVTT